MRSQLLGRVSGVATSQTKKQTKQKNKFRWKKESVHECVFCYISILLAFLSICMTPNSLQECPWAGLPGHPVTAHHSYAFLMSWEGWQCGGSLDQKPKTRTLWEKSARDGLSGPRGLVDARYHGGSGASLRPARGFHHFLEELLRLATTTWRRDALLLGAAMAAGSGWASGDTRCVVRGH